MGTTTPLSEELRPTAMQLVALAQVTPKRELVPGTGCGVPGAPLTMGTIRPPLGELPTAMQAVALEQATPASSLAPETGSTLPGTPLVMGTTASWPELVPPTATQVFTLE